MIRMTVSVFPPKKPRGCRRPADERRDRGGAEADEQRDRAPAIRGASTMLARRRPFRAGPRSEARTRRRPCAGSPPTSSGPKSPRKTKTSTRPRPSLTCSQDGRDDCAPLQRAGRGGRLLDRRGACSDRAHSLRHPRVELEVQEVGEQVEDDHRQREEEERRLQHRVVALVDRLDDEEADARIREDVLDGDRAPPMMNPSERATSVMTGASRCGTRASRPSTSSRGLSRAT